MALSYGNPAMFRPSDRQTSLLEPHLVLSTPKRERLEASWAHGCIHPTNHATKSPSTSP